MNPSQTWINAESSRSQYQMYSAINVRVGRTQIIAKVFNAKITNTIPQPSFRRAVALVDKRRT